MLDLWKKTGPPVSEALWATWIALGLALVFTHCGGTAPVVLSSLSISPASPSLVAGSTQQFTATGSYSNGSTQDLSVSVTWSSSNAQVATLSSTGLATVKKAGSVTITATLGLISGSTLPLVAVLKLESISVSPESASIPLGTSQQFTATGSYSDQSTQSLTNSASWRSSSMAVATVNASGLVTSVTTGAATITASVASVSGGTSGVTTSGTASLTVGPAVSISVSPSTASVVVGQSQQFTATIANTSDTNVTWSVDGVAGGNATVGTISSSGLYQTPAGPGAHTIAAASQLDPTKKAQANATVSYTGMLIYHNDLARTGQNLNETILTPSNVTSKQFGKLFSYPVDGGTYAQPLYVQSVTVGNQGVYNVVYVATENDSVYAFDADGKVNTPLWHVSVINPTAGITTVPPPAGDDAFPVGAIGITSTPAIDPVSGTLYVVSYTLENGQATYRLHALDLGTGAERLGSPVVITATVAGTGDGTNGQGQVPFDPAWHLQRQALLLLNGTLYIGFASHGDIRPYHGWLLAYDATTLKQTAVLNTTPNGLQGGIWEGGCGAAVDASGNIYIAIANGTFDASAGGLNFGDSVLRLDPSSLAVRDWFAPFNQADLSAGDVDVGSGGPMLLPDQPGSYPHLLTVAGKEGRIYLLDRDHLGGYGTNSDTGAVQELIGQINPNNLTTPAYWESDVYYASEDDNLKMFSLTNGLLSSSPKSLSQVSYGHAGATVSISASGSTNGIAWAINTSAYSSGGAAQLYAYDATDVSHELYDSSQAGTRDTPGAANKFAVPTVINGKVYVGTATELDVFGLLGE